MNYGLEGKVVIVTGGSKGVGKGIVEAFLNSNASVIFTSRNEEEGKKTEAELSELGTVEYQKSDVGEEEAVKALINYVVEKYGKIDCVVNNAAYVVSPTMNLHESEYALFQDVYRANVGGLFLMMKYAIEKMLEQPEKGCIVNISSAISLTSWQKYSIYGSSKRAVNAITQIAANEYGGSGIRINAVIPGTIETERFAATRVKRPDITEHLEAQVPLKRFATPSELGNTVVWLCSKEASYVTGVLLPVDGGLVL